MAKFTWLDGSKGVWQYASFDRYVVTKITSKKIQLQFDDNRLGYSPQRDPYSITIKVKGGSLDTIKQGPNAGQKILTSGTINNVDYFDKTGNAIIKISGLDLPAYVVSNWMTTGQKQQVDDFIWSGTKHTFIGSEDASGTNQGTYGDTIETSPQNDVVKAGAGDDIAIDAGGADKYNLGSGDADLLTYGDWYYTPAHVKSGVNVDLAQGTASGPDGFTDTVKGVEHVHGTFLDDTFVGDGKDNLFVGFLGNDSFDGGKGLDTVSYVTEVNSGGRDGVTVNLNTGVGRDSFGTKDTYNNIERVVGTDEKDVFTGNKKDNWFVGNDGGDVFVFEGKKFGTDTVEDFSRVEGDVLHLTGAQGFGRLNIKYEKGSGDAVVSFAKGTIIVEDWVANNPGDKLVASDFDFG